MIFPPEIFFLIVNNILQDDLDSYLTIFSLLNLAESCRLLYDLIESKIEARLKGLGDFLPFLRAEFPERDWRPIAFYCKWKLNICAFCNNRARECLEMNSFIQVCHPCEAIFFPKISEPYLPFDVTPKVDEYLNELHYVQIGWTKLYRWKDIQTLFTKEGVRFRNPPPARVYRRLEYAFWDLSTFAPDGVRDLDEIPYYTLREGYLRWVCDSANSSLPRVHPHLWLRPPPLPQNPIQVELALFSEFQYRFNSRWLEERNYDLCFHEYGRVVRHWATSRLWPERPWRLNNFPIHGRCSITYLYATELEKAHDEYDLNAYQERCRLFRAVIHAFPDIQCCPDIWRRCVTRKKGGLTKCIDIAKDAAEKYKPKIWIGGFEVELFTNYFYEIEFVRSGQKLKGYHIPWTTRVAIVSYHNETLVEVR